MIIIFIEHLTGQAFDVFCPLSWTKHYIVGNGIYIGTKIKQSSWTQTQVLWRPAHSYHSTTNAAAILKPLLNYLKSSYSSFDPPLTPNTS